MATYREALAARAAAGQEKSYTETWAGTPTAAAWAAQAAKNQKEAEARAARAEEEQAFQAEDRRARAKRIMDKIEELEDLLMGESDYRAGAVLDKKIRVLYAKLAELGIQKKRLVFWRTDRLRFNSP